MNTLNNLTFSLKQKIKNNLHKKNMIFLCIDFMCGFNCFVIFFLPILQIAAQNENNSFYLSCFNLLIKPLILLQLPAKTVVVKILPVSTILINLTFLFNIGGTMLFNMKKFRGAATTFFCACLCPLVALPTVNALKNDLLALQISSNRIFIEFLWPFFILICFNLCCVVVSLFMLSAHHLAKTIFFSSSCFTIILVLFIIVYILIASFPAINKIGLFNFLFKSEWKPSLNKFGILNLIKSSVWATLGSIVVASPIGILTAIFMSEFCPKPLLFCLKPLVELLAGVPSVVFGFFAVNLIVPSIQKIFQNFTTSDGAPVVGDSLLAVILVLTIMILPTIVSTSFNALNSVPKHFKEAAFGLGANKIETIFKVCVPAAKTSIASGLVLAIGRAVGETMAVIMVAGNIAKPPEILGTVRLLTTGIAIDLGYASGILKSALFAIGLVLLILIITINLSFNFICKKGVFSNDHKFKQ